MNIPTEFLIAGIAGAAVLLLFLGIAAKPAPDAVQQRLSQLVAQPRTLEESSSRHRSSSGPSARWSSGCPT